MTQQRIAPTDAPGGTGQTVTEVSTPGRASSLARRAFLDYGMVWLLVITLVVTAIIDPPFYTTANIENVLIQNAPLGVVSIAVTLLLIGGGLDFSPAGTYSLCAVVFALTADEVPLGVALLFALATGLLCGAVTAFAVEGLRVTDFIATLGTASIFGGLAFLVSGSRPVIPENESFGRISTTLIAGIPLPIIVLLAVLALGWFVLEGSLFGRWLYILGGNREAGRLAGVNVRMVKVAAFVLVGLATGLAAVLGSSQLSVAQGNLNPNLALDAFTIVIIGGTSMFGGEGRMWRTVVG